MLILSPALQQAHVHLPDSSETPLLDLTHCQRGSEESGDLPETRKSRSFSTSQVRKHDRWKCRKHSCVFLKIWAIVFSSSKHPSACVKKWLHRSSQSEEASAHVGATDQPPEENVGQTATVQFPRVIRDDCGWSKVSGRQEGLPVLQTRLSAERQDVRWVREDYNINIPGQWH